jgi:hypothetical protein
MENASPKVLFTFTTLHGVIYQKIGIQYFSFKSFAMHLKSFLKKNKYTYNIYEPQ